MNILDFMLGLALLAVVPFALAAYGGHVAADALPPSTRRNVKLKFWGLFIIGVAIAALSQYRTMRQDAVREGKAEEAKKQYMSAADEFKNATTTVLS